MMNSINLAIMLLMATSIISLVLEAIGNKNNKNSIEKPHIRLFAIGSIIISFLLILLSLLGKVQLPKRPFLFMSEISSLFLIFNTLITIFLAQKTLKNQSGEIYFLIVAALAISLSNVSTTYIVMKMVTTTSWLILLTTLTVRATEGGKKAEIGLKMAYLTIIVVILYFLAIFIFCYGNFPLDLELVTLKNNEYLTLGIFSILLIFLAGLALSGTPPLHFAHVDCADGSDISISFLFLTNSLTQAGVLLTQIKTIFLKSGLDNDGQTIGFAALLIFGFMVLWLRALDQSKIRRTIAFAATSVGPLFSLTMLFGVSVLLPKLIFLLAIFSFVTLTIFTMCGSLAYMGPLNKSYQTWEDMAGFGRKNPWQTLTLLAALSAITGLPGTLGYFIKLSLIGPFQNNIILSISIFLSIAIGAACTMRVFVFAFSKVAYTLKDEFLSKPHFTVVLAAFVLIALGFFPFVH